ncbi:MAG: hypothetical protein JO076_08640 [Verrucomicrobia bacterium]|nr:hypothetical protein [Verrucomicrobiota bacterium]
MQHRRSQEHRLWLGITLLILDAVPSYFAEDTSSLDKVIRSTLNQDVPALVQVGTEGVTSIEFPHKIQAIDGYGISQSPTSSDSFQLLFAKGTNFFSLRALKPNATANLAVVLDDKIYCLILKESSNPSFVVIFNSPSDLTSSETIEQNGLKKNTGPQLARLIVRAKNYETLKSEAPGGFDALSVAEPGTRIFIAEKVDLVVKRVIVDRSVGAAVFELQINNQSDQDFLYDPESFALRVQGQIYRQCFQDASGLVNANTIAKAFFVVNGSVTKDWNGLVPPGDFNIILRQVRGTKDNQISFNEPPTDLLPTAETMKQSQCLGQKTASIRDEGDPKSRLGKRGKR